MIKTEDAMKRAYPVLKSLWFLLVILLILINRGLPFPVLAVLTAVVLLAPLVRDYLFKQRPDERQVEISHFASHIAYLVFFVLDVMVLLRIKVPEDAGSPWLFFLLLAVPVALKFSISLYQHYGTVHGFSGLAAVLLRGVLPLRRVDERQNAIGNFSSHIAFYVWLTLMVLFIFIKFISRGENPTTVWYALLMTPLLIRLYASFLLTYGGRSGGRFIVYTIIGITLLFVLLSHGLSLESAIEASPFLLVAALAIWAMRFPRVTGVLLCVVALGSVYFFHGWRNFDLYMRITMFSLIPVPIFLGGIAMVLKHREVND